MVMNLLTRDRAGASNPAPPQALLADQTLRERYEAARASGADAGTDPKKKGAGPPAPGGNGVHLGRGVEYPYFLANGAASDTLLWHPTLWLADGNGTVHFDIPRASATYRVILLGHSPTGRFGFYETRLDVPSFEGR